MIVWNIGVEILMFIVWIIWVISNIWKLMVKYVSVVFRLKISMVVKYKYLELIWVSN